MYVLYVKELPWLSVSGWFSAYLLPSLRCVQYAVFSIGGYSKHYHDTYYRPVDRAGNGLVTN
jgi:hypothetical protein